MSGMMKICGKSPSSTAKAIAVDENGNLLVKRIWETSVVNIATADTRDTTAVYYPNASGIDVSDYALIAIRVKNNTDQAVNIILADNGNYIKRTDGSNYSFDIPASSLVVLTADDLPVINMLPSFSLRTKFSVAPTSGRLTIDVIKKR